MALIFLMLDLHIFEIFDLWFFSSNNTIWAPDSRVQAFSNMASNWRSYQQSRLHSGVNDFAVADTVVSMTPLD
jgi:hypothetical protein